MALIHDVIDSDVRFTIDPVTRTISNQGSKKLVLTRGDHNSERFTFEIPRYVEGHDMSLCNVVRIHFINTDSRTREEMADIYEPDDASLLPSDDQIFTFSWLIERTATSFAGPLAFAIEFQCVVEGTVVYSWRTAANSTITIVNGINNAISTDVEVDEPPIDIYSTIRVATVASMIHDVIDSDVRFVIDPVTRAISNQDSKKLILIQGDHKSERFTFEIPRLVEGHDMSLCNVVRIHYINTNSKTRSVVTDIYEPTDMGVHPTLTDIVTFSWLIGRSATTFAGTLAFSVEFQCVVDDIVEYSWHTGINNTIAISDGISNSEVLNEEYSDILTIWWERLYSSSELPIEIITTEMMKDPGFSTQDNTLYILEDDPTLEEIEQVIEKTKEFDTQLTEHLEQYETLDKSMSEHLEKYTELDKNISEHFEDFESLLSKVTLLEERLHKLETGSGDGTCEHEWVETVVNPTCTERGYTLHTCSKCDYSYVDSYTDATGHVWSYIQQGPDLWDRHCSVCGEKEYDVEFPCTDGTEHVWEELAVVDATCTTAAVQRYQCRNCDATKDGEVIQEALGHNYVESVVTDNTCTEPAIQKYTCTRCQTEKPFEESDVVRDPLGHSWSDAIYDAVGYYEPTCTETGLAGYVCEYCGEEKSETVPALGHTWSDPIEWGDGYARECTKCGLTEPIQDETCDHTDEVIETVQATCTSGGYTTYKCSLCGREETREYTDALGHNYESVVTDPTCTAQGYTTHTCSRCGDSYADNYTSTVSHSWSGWSTTIEPTCTEDGTESRTCSVCNETETQGIEALGHPNQTYHEGKEATCTEDGYTAYNTCTKCGEIIDGKNVIKALGHDLTTIPEVPATCTEYGRTALTTCSRCSYSSGGESIEPNGHSFLDGWVEHKAPTCTEAGVKRRYCANCDYYEADSIPATGHDYTSTVTKEATCSEEGVRTYTCTRCNDSYTEEIAMVECSFVFDSTVQPTCTSGGYDIYKCTMCGTAQNRNQKDALGHDYTSTVTKEATCSEEGVRTYTCTRCNDSYTEEIATVECNFVFDSTVQPTCTTGGYDIYKCTMCGGASHRNQTNALGHDYEAVEDSSQSSGYIGVCERCGDTVEDYNP